MYPIRGRKLCLYDINNYEEKKCYKIPKLDEANLAKSDKNKCSDEKRCAKNAKCGGCRWFSISNPVLYCDVKLSSTEAYITFAGIQRL